MAVDIGRLNISIAANSGAFTAGMNQAVQSANAMNNSVTRAMNQAAATTSKALPTPKMPDVLIHVQIDLPRMMADLTKVGEEAQRKLSSVSMNIGVHTTAPGAQINSPSAGMSGSGAILTGAAAGIGAAVLLRKSQTEQVKADESKKQAEKEKTAATGPTPGLTPRQKSALSSAWDDKQTASLEAMASAMANPGITTSAGKGKARAIPPEIPTNRMRYTQAKLAREAAAANRAASAEAKNASMPDIPKSSMVQRTFWQRMTNSGYLDDAESGIGKMGTWIGEKFKAMAAKGAEAAKAPIKARGDIAAGLLTGATDLTGGAVTRGGGYLGKLIAGSDSSGVVGGSRRVLGGGLAASSIVAGTAIQTTGRVIGRSIQGASIIAQKATDVMITAFKRLSVVAGGFTLAGLTAGLAVFKSTSADILQTDIQVRRLGISILDLRSASLLGGAATSSLVDAIDMLGGRSAEMTRGVGPTIKMFQDLGALSGQKFNMTVGQIGGMDTVEQFDAIATRIAAIKDPMQQANTAARIFGKSWIDILPILQRGGNALGEARDAARRFGLAVGPQDVANLGEVSRSMRDMGAIWEGLKTQFTLGVGGIAAELSKSFDLSAVNISGFRDTVVDVAETVAKVGATIIAAWSDTSLIKEAWESSINYIVGFAKVQFGKILSEIGGQLKGTFLDKGGHMLLLEGAGNLFQAQGGLQQVKAEKRLGNLGNDLKTTAPWQAVEDFFGNVRNRMAPDAKPNPLQVNPALVQQLRDVRQQMGTILATPLQTFQQQMRDIKLLQDAGEFAGPGGDKQLARLQATAFGNLSSGMNLQGPQFAGAAEAFSREAYSAVARHESQQNRQTVQEQMKAILEEQKRIEEEQLRISQDLLNFLRNQPDPVAVKI